MQTAVRLLLKINRTVTQLCAKKKTSKRLLIDTFSLNIFADILLKSCMLVQSSIEMCLKYGEVY